MGGKYVGSVSVINDHVCMYVWNLSAPRLLLSILFIYLFALIDSKSYSCSFLYPNFVYLNKCVFVFIFINVNILHYVYLYMYGILYNVFMCMDEQ